MDRKIFVFIFVLSGLSLISCSSAVSVMYNAHYVNYNYFNTFNFKNPKTNDKSSIVNTDEVITKKLKRTRLEQISNYNAQNTNDKFLDTTGVIAKKIKRNRFDDSLNFNNLHQSLDKSTISYIQQFFDNTVLGQQQNDITKSLYELNIFTKKIENNVYLYVTSISSSKDTNLTTIVLLQLAHEIENNQYLLLVCFIPLSIYVFIRSKSEKINSKHFLSFFFIVILISSSTVTPFSTFGNYEWMAFGESNPSDKNTGPSHFSSNSNSTISFQFSNATNYIPSNHSSTISFQFSNATKLIPQQSNSTISFQFSNATNYIPSNHSSTISFQFSNATTSIIKNNSHNNTTFPIPTQSWNFTSSILKTLSVGKTRIDNSTNTTSLQLNGNGYLKQNVISTKNLSALTLSAWVKPDYSHGSSQFTVISKENTFILAINNDIPPSKKAIFSIFDGIKWNTVTSNSTIPEDWTNLVATYDNSSIGIYVNGLQESKIPLTGIPTISITGKIENRTGIILSSNSDVAIGAYLNSLRSQSDNLFSGSIRDVTLYTSTLSASQINKIYLQNAFIFNPSYSTSNATTINTPVIINSQLNHTYIEINKPVTWTQNVTLSQTANLAIQIPSDAKILDVNATKMEYTTDISKLQILNQTSNANTTIISNKVVPIASLNPQMIESNKTSKLLVINYTAEQYQLKFQTPAPYTLETNESSSNQFSKQIRVLNNSTLHYTDVKSYTNLPRDLVMKGIHFKLFWMINGTKTDVTNDPRFHVQFVDTDRDGIVDQMQWIVPHLSEQDFQVEEDDNGNDNGNDGNNNCNNDGEHNGNNNDGEHNGNNNDGEHNGNNNDGEHNGNNNDGEHNGNNNDNHDCGSQQFSIQLSENIGLSDTASTSSIHNIVLQEQLGLSDTASTSSIHNIVLQEQLGLSDTASTSSIHNIVLQEQLGLSDTEPFLLPLAANQQLVNTQKEIIINSTKTDLVITSPNVNLTTIIVPQTTVATTLNYSSIVQTNSTSSTVSITNGLTILQNTTSAIPTIQVTLPPALTITGNASWNGVLNLPHVISAPSIPVEANTVNTVTNSIEIGSDTVSLTFNKAVRLVFTGQAGQRIGYFNSITPFTEITATCNDDTQTTNNNLPSNGACKTNVGPDLVVWTKHFTGFATWSSNTSSSVSTTGSVSSVGGGGGTGTGFGVGTYGAPSSNGGGAGPYLKIEKISYETCDNQTAIIQVATDVSDVDPMVIVRTSVTGVVSAQLLANQPYAQENSNSTIRHLVYQASLSPKETSFEVVALESINHNIFSVGKTVIVNGCGENLDYTQTEITISPVQVDLSAPKIFDVKYQIGNGTKILADNPSQYVDNKPITVYSIVDSKIPITHTYLRSIKFGQNESKYDQIDMTASPLLISNSTYLVSGTIPTDMISAPAIKYWIHVENQDGQIDSPEYDLAIKPQYSINGKLDLYVVSDRAEGTVATPAAFLTNNSTGPVYGTIILVVDGNPVYVSPMHIFGPGLTKINLQWDTLSTGKMLSHHLTAQAKFYDKIISSPESTINTFPSVKTIPISNTINIQSMIDDKGNVIATPDILYSSHPHETGMSYRVTAPDGTCIIGNNCLVNKSTYDLQDQVMKINMGNQLYNVRYSGSESLLERFTISSVDPILGHWSVDLESNENLIPQAQAMEKIPLKIQYHTADTSGLQ
ncbi:LamG domain-containing protein [Nitrosotalea sinensis]|uniref:LamG domain-containing protein n=1 Tax=Nitrosotalea sinensis TaxID=1499975 RepID=UPI001C444778|nr:LamG domain-containing protein [Candidatus Nitrosotalea sinensis]